MARKEKKYHFIYKTTNLLKRYNVKSETISKIKRGLIWKNITIG